MKNVDSLLKAELEKLGVPVERLKYGGKAACFIVYQLVVGRDTFFSDDEEGAQEFTYQVHVYSKNGLHRHSSTLENSIEGGGVLRDHDRRGNIRTGHGILPRSR